VLATPSKPAFISHKGWWIKDGEVHHRRLGWHQDHEQMRSVRLDKVVVLSTRSKNQLQEPRR
jgi:hypothetical protein